MIEWKTKNISNSFQNFKIILKCRKIFIEFKDGLILVFNKNNGSFLSNGKILKKSILFT